MNRSVRHSKGSSGSLSASVRPVKRIHSSFTHSNQDDRMYSPVDALSTQKRADDDAGGRLQRPLVGSTWRGAAFAEPPVRAPPRARQNVHCSQGSGEPGPVAIGPTAPMLRLLPQPYRMAGCRRKPKRPWSPTQAAFMGQLRLENRRRRHVHQ
jgi:hypothetical protein